MTGRIIKGIGGFYYIKVDDKIIECKARGKFRHNSLKPMVGDYVNISVENGNGVIEDILERSSELIRPMVSNVTQAYVVFAIKNPNINFDLFNKFLILCGYNDIKLTVCLNKVDLCTEKEMQDIKDMINNIGYEVLFINAKDGIGIDELKNMLKDETTVLCGPSGAGKSTIINKFLGVTHMQTGSVSDKIGRGKHTTRHSELVDVNGGYLVDTPGFSTLDISNFLDKENLKLCFRDFKEYNNKCKFNGCNHFKEPGCAVRVAVEDGKINLHRYEFYLKTLEEIDNRRKKKW